MLSFTALVRPDCKRESPAPRQKRMRSAFKGTQKWDFTSKMGKYKHRWTIYRAQVQTETAIFALIFFLKESKSIKLCSWLLIAFPHGQKRWCSMLNVQGYKLWEETTVNRKAAFPRLWKLVSNLIQNTDLSNTRQSAMRSRQTWNAGEEQSGHSGEDGIESSQRWQENRAVPQPCQAIFL